MVLKKKGFTLVELLVVISIISLLLSILIPALGRAREIARRAICASNLHQWGLAINAYSSDSKGKIPATFGKYVGQQWPSYIADDATMRGDGEFCIAYFGSYVSGTDVKSRKLPKNVWFCPSTTDMYRQQAEQMWQSAGYFHFTYGYWAHFDASWVSYFLSTALQKQMVSELTNRELTSGKLVMNDNLIWFGEDYPIKYGWAYNHGLRGPSATHSFWRINIDMGPPKIAGTNNLFGDISVRWKPRSAFRLRDMQKKKNWPFIGTGATY